MSSSNNEAAVSNKKLRVELRQMRRNYLNLAQENSKLKQRLHDGDRSHPSIVALDETKASLSYPGWRSDAAKAEMVWGFDMFCRYLPEDIDKSVATMKRKQEYHEALPPPEYDDW